MIILFAVKFREWNLPYLPINGVKDTRNPGGFRDLVEHMILPVIALAIPQIAGWIWYIRNAMLEVLNQDFIRTSRSLGLKEHSVRYLARVQELPDAACHACRTFAAGPLRRCPHC